MVNGTRMSVPKRFRALRFIAITLKVLAWVTLVLAVLAVIAVTVAGTLYSGEIERLLLGLGLPSTLIGVGPSAILSGLALLFSGLLQFLILFGAADSIYLRISVEENTRLAAALLLKMEQESQVERSPYSGSY